MAKLSSVIVFVNPQVFDEMGKQVRIFWRNETPCWEFLLETKSWPKECDIWRRASETDFLQREEATILLFKKSIKDSSWYNARGKWLFHFAGKPLLFFHRAGKPLLFDGNHIGSDLSDRHLIILNVSPRILLFYYFLCRELYTLFPYKKSL